MLVILLPHPPPPQDNLSSQMLAFTQLWSPFHIPVHQGEDMLMGTVHHLQSSLPAPIPPHQSPPLFSCKGRDHLGEVEGKKLHISLAFVGWSTGLTMEMQLWAVPAEKRLQVVRALEYPSLQQGSKAASSPGSGDLQIWGFRGLAVGELSCGEGSVFWLSFVLPLLPLEWNVLH